MQETVRSVRMYFGVVGVISGLINGAMLTQGIAATNIVLILLGGIGIVISIAFLVMAFLLPKLLPNGAPIPKAIIGINCLLAVGLIALLVLLLPPEQAGAESVKPIISLLISWYLWANLTRLSKEHDAKFA